MRCFASPSAAGAAVRVMFFVCSIATGQTMLDLRSQARNVDFSAAASTRPFSVGTVLPSTCAVGQTFFRQDAAPGRNLYICAATNIWAGIAGEQEPSTGSSGGILITPTEDSYSLDVDTSVVATQTGTNRFTGDNDFSHSASLNIVVSTSKPPDSGCDTADEVGRIVLHRSDVGKSAGVLYLCQATTTGTFGWKVSNHSYGSGRPASCETGQMFFDTAGSAGQQWFGCVATNTWVNLTGSSSLPEQSGNAGKLLISNGTAAGWRGIAGFTDDGSVLMPDGSLLSELAANNTWTGHQSYPASATQNLINSSSIMCNRRTVAISAAAPLVLTSAATIADASDGRVCVIANVGANSITLQDQDKLPLSNLQLAAPQVTIPPNGQITLQFNATVGDWIQDGVSPADLQDTTANGMVVRTGSGGVTMARTITGANGVSVLNGSGVAGNPVVSLPGSSKGDMIVHNGSENTRMAAGANGEALVADPSGPIGVRWAGRSVAGANGVSVTNGTWTSGDTVTVSMPGSSRGDIMVHNGLTNTHVAVGPDGQVLTADSTQPAGLKWANVSIPTLPTTTKGDIIVHNGNQNQRLAAGSTGQTLVADSSQPAGLKWAARSVTGSNGLTVTNGDWSTGDAARIDLPGTNKGDISVHNGATNSVVPVGENGTVLTADSTSANGVKWSPADTDIRYCQNVTASITGTTTMTDLRSGIVLPTLIPGDMVVNEAIFSKTPNSANTMSVQLLQNNTRLANTQSDLATTHSLNVYRITTYVTGTSSQVSHVEGISNSGSSQSQGPTSTAINNTTPTLKWQGRNANGSANTDTLTLVNWCITIKHARP